MPYRSALGEAQELMMIRNLVFLKEEQTEAQEEFALGRLKQSYGYMQAQRQMTADEKFFKWDLLTGCAGEFITHEVLTSLGTQITTPDLQLYQVKDKNWDADLVIERDNGDTIHLHIKSQNTRQRKKFGHSWTFQRQNKNGRGGTNHIFLKSEDELRQNYSNHYVVMVDVAGNWDAKNPGHDRGWIAAVLPVWAIPYHELFGKPVKEDKQQVKMVIYYKTIVEKCPQFTNGGHCMDMLGI